MALPALDYAWLQAEIAAWLHRDLSARIPTFIVMAESRMNRKLRLRVMESDEPVALASGARTIALPTGYIEPISLGLTISGTPRDYLSYVLPTQLPIDPTSTAASRPRQFTINGANIEFPKLADQSYAMNFRMLKAFGLSDSATTNWLLTNHPDIYLFGALLEATPYVRDDARIGIWQDRYDRAMSEISNKEARSKVLSRLVTESPLRNRRSFNVISGD